MKIKLNENVKGIIALSVSGALFLLTAIFLLFVPLGFNNAVGYLRDTASPNFFAGLALLLLALACLTVTALSFVNYFVFKKKKFSRLKIGALVNLICLLLFCTVAIIVVQSLTYLVFVALGILLFIGVYIFATEQKSTEDGKTQSPVTAKQIKEGIVSSGQTVLSFSVVCASLAAFLLNSCLLLVMPLFAQKGDYLTTRPSVLQIFNAFGSYGIFDQIFCAAFILLLVGGFIFLINVALKFFVNTLQFLKIGKTFAKYNIFMTFFVMGFSLVKLFIAKFTSMDTFFITFVNVITAYAIYIVFTIFSGSAKRAAEAKQAQTAVKKAPRKDSPLPLIFLALMTAATFSILFVTLFTLDINAPTGSLHESATGLSVLRTMNQGGFQNAIALFLLLFCIGSTVLLILTVLNYIVNDAHYKQSALSYSYANLFFQFFFFAIGLFYVLMAPSFTSILSLVFGDVAEALGTDITISDYVKTTTLAYLPFLIGVVLIILMQVLCFGRRSAHAAQTASAKDEGGFSPSSNKTEIVSPDAPVAVKVEDDANLIDPCPAFSGLDSKLPEYKQDYQKRKNAVFENLTLESLTKFVVEFAKNMPERLSYSVDTVATFIAGLGASKLSILQGMSGTGKTSLPKMFMQAINGNCDIVEVESSWRDKNELLGYYNEFNGIYSPKSFTQFLYKAALNENVPTFIVLDEMNLSRIEYYFSDFLSIMEANDDLRTIKLLEKRIFPPATPKDSEPNYSAGSYLRLINGNTLKIPSNVWFVGTANRDESTFEISDKVYDRAQTINFEKRAPKILTKRVAVPPRFVEYDRLNSLFEEVKKAEFNAESDPLVLAVEKILTPYKISFGNRILKQIEDFVKVYLACNDTSTHEKYRHMQHKAIENILYSKVLRKLELKVVENKAQLAESFEKIDCKLCAEFVRQLADI